MNDVANVIWNSIFNVPDEKDSLKHVDIVFFSRTQVFWEETKTKFTTIAILI